MVLRGKTVVQQYGIKTLNGNRNALKQKQMLSVITAYYYYYYYYISKAPADRNFIDAGVSQVSWKMPGIQHNENLFGQCKAMCG